RLIPENRSEQFLRRIQSEKKPSLRLWAPLITHKITTFQHPFYIAKLLDREEFVEFTEEEVTRERRKLRVIRFSVMLLELLPKFTDSASHMYSQYTVISALNDLLENNIPPDEKNKVERKSVSITNCPSFIDELLRYGFVQRVVRDSNSKTVSIFDRSYNFDYTDRLERFKYWLTFKEMMPEKVDWKLIDIEQLNDQDDVVQ
ncbi:MAG: hypothetical protein D3903_21060, partial [Candidatus Electrothrix sp. GM3_4]|nr:hypothetical protein [Candidatus Electrothrix sp. GM3_4]